MLLHLAKILEILGFVFAIIFGGILLNREMFWRFAVRVDERLNVFSAVLETRFRSISKFALFLSSNEITRSMLGATIIRGISIVCIIIGWVNDITWLLWFGIAWALLYVLIGIVFVFVMVKSRFGTNKLWLYPILLCWSLILSFLFAPIVLFIYFLVLYLLLLIMFVITTVAREDALKKTLVIFGSILIIIGLILETVITW